MKGKVHDMALYEILETPGKTLVSPERLTEAGWDGHKINNADKAKIIVQALRARAKADKKKVDFVVVTKKDLEGDGSTGPSSSAGGTSIRLQEEQRKELAKIVGKHMWETGNNISMGDAVVMLISERRRLEEENIALRARVAELEADDE